MIDPIKIRKKILTLAYRAQTAHVACALSITDILCALYSYFPNEEIILSKGHGAMALYAVKNELGEITDDQIANYFRNGSSLFGLVSGFGSLGHGLPIATGIAFALKRKKSNKKVFCIVGDGELDEGSCREAVDLAVELHLDNLYILVDRNGWQAMRRIKKYGHDGHDIVAIKQAILDFKPPGLIDFKTIKGAGVSFMEDRNEWHYQRLSEEQYKKAMSELENEAHCGAS